jgi:hypothetical protein
MVGNVFAPARATLLGLAVIIAIPTFASGNVASPPQPHLSGAACFSGLNGPLANQCSMVRRGVYHVDPLQLRSVYRRGQAAPISTTQEESFRLPLERSAYPRRSMKTRLYQRTRVYNNLSGGLEASGPFIILDKHQCMLHASTDMIARKLGNALIAPVIRYVPPDDGNRGNYPGDFDISLAAYKSTLPEIAWLSKTTDSRRSSCQGIIRAHSGV